ncbi:MAG: DUF2252 domain-containing protein [Acidimicrobiia bacterium]|nr:DUF2252 domain-containing protein [Acidimicrobiia bacterium]
MTPTADEARDARRQRGKDARQRAPRRGFGDYEPGKRTQDALATLVAQNAVRDQSLVPLRFERMAVSPWTYLRGAAAVMAADLADHSSSGLNVQLAGDAHVLNFGLWATPERNLSFDLRDFDETHPGPFEWDVARLATSLVVIGRDHGLSAKQGQRAVAAAVDSYRERMGLHATMSELDTWYHRVDVDDLVGHFASEAGEELRVWIDRKAERRTSEGAAEKLVEVVDGRPRITEEPPVRQRVDDQAELQTIIDVASAYSGSLPSHIRHLLGRFSLVDAVQQVVGVGSVGMRVYLVLLAGHTADSPLFLQVKQATESVYEPHLGRSRYRNSGSRVVHGQRLIQSASDIFLGWTRKDGQDFYVRQFRDMKVVPDGELIAPHLEDFATACGDVLAKAHARTGDAIAIASYLGSSEGFTEAMGRFAEAYADQTEADHAQLAAAVDAGDVPT